MGLHKLAIYILIGVSSLSLLFTNCGRVGPQGLLASSGLQNDVAEAPEKLGCEIERKNAYGRTFFQFFRSNCTNCHQHTQSHASQDMNVSFNSFRQTGQEVIDYQATHPHGGNQFGAANREAIDAILPEWNAAQVEYYECMSSNGEEEIPVIPLWRDIKLKNKLIPNIAQTETNQSLWLEVKWNLSTEVEPTSEQGKISGEFIVNIRYWMIEKDGNYTNAGLSIKNPRIRLNSGQKDIYLDGLKFFLDGVFKSGATNYLLLDRTLSFGGSGNLGENEVIQQLGWETQTRRPELAIEMLSVSIGEEIAARNGTGEVDAPETPKPPPVGGTPTPTPTPGVVITHADLVNGLPAVRIFGDSCVSCHNSNNRRGNLDLTNYNEAFARRNAILSRMTDSSSPMPQGGLLSNSKIDKVRNWVNNGAPQF